MNIIIKVDGFKNPIQITSLTPEFSFYIEDEDNDVYVNSYRIKVFSDEKKTETVWDSQVVKSDETRNVGYSGRLLEYDKKYFGEVSVTTNKGVTDTQEFYFCTPIKQFLGKWISRAEGKYDCEPLFRYSFKLKNKKIATAKLFATALGLYEVHLNGKRIGNSQMAPGYTDYAYEVNYDTYDVSKEIKNGKNAIGVLLGKGWYCGHVFLWNECYGKNICFSAFIKVEYEDGSSEIVITSNAWKNLDNAPYLSTDNNNGETFDARRNAEFSDTAYDDSAWSNCIEVDDETSGHKVNLLSRVKIKPAFTDPVSIYDRIKPISKIYDEENELYIFDMGQNFAGIAGFKLRGEKDTRITIRYGEMLDDRVKGKIKLYTENLRKAKATDTYIKATDGEEYYEPKFTFHGYRYIEIKGVKDITIDDVVGLPISSQMERTGEITTGNERVNRLYENIVWGQRSNYLSIPTDCPQRDERAGWTGDAQVFVRTGTYNFDTQNFFKKYLNDMNTARNRAKRGIYPIYCPYSNIGVDIWGGEFSPAWSDAGVIITDAMYDVYRDKRIIEDNLDGMIALVEGYRSYAHDNILIGIGCSYGDWLSVVETPKILTNTAYYAHSARLLSKLAGIIGRNDLRIKYEKLFLQIKKAYNKEFVSGDYHIYGNTQTSYLISLYFDLIDGERGKRIVAKRLVADIKKRGNLLSSGFIGVAMLNNVLTEYGYNDVAYDLFLQEKYPSWLYPVINGATTIWERWNSYTIENGFGDVGMNSFNHYSLGAVGEWMFRYMVGIDSYDGYKNIILRPTMDARLGFANGSYCSPYGKISSGWRIENDKYIYNVVIPANTTARLYLYDCDTLTINGKKTGDCSGVKSISKENGKSVIELANGKYEIVGKYVQIKTPDSLADSCDFDKKKHARDLRKSNSKNAKWLFIASVKKMLGIKR